MAVCRAYCGRTAPVVAVCSEASQVSFKHARTHSLLLSHSRVSLASCGVEMRVRKPRLCRTYLVGKSDYDALFCCEVFPCACRPPPTLASLQYPSFPFVLSEAFLFFRSLIFIAFFLAYFFSFSPLPPLHLIFQIAPPVFTSRSMEAQVAQPGGVQDRRRPRQIRSEAYV